MRLCVYQSCVHMLCNIVPVETRYGMTFLLLLSLITSPPPPHTEQETKVTADTVDYQKVADLLRCPLSPLASPAHAGELCLWGEEGTYDHVELEYGQQVRLKTRGNSPLIGERSSTCTRTLYILCL